MSQFWIQRSILFFLSLVIFGTVGSRGAFAQTDLQGSETSQIEPVEVQKALAEAGFYTGAIDGIIGRKTRAAIRAFQEKNGLAVDGKCGPRTWEVLKVYLEETAEDKTSSSDALEDLPPSPIDEETTRLGASVEPTPEFESGKLKQKLVS